MSIIIIGAGMTGSVLALAISNLSHGKIPVSIVEMNDISKNKNFNNKTVALSAGTCKALDDIDIWQVLKRFATPITKIYVNEKNNFGSLIFNAQDYSIPALAYSVELKKISKKMFYLIKKAKGITIHCPVSVIKLLYNKEKIIVFLSNGNILHGKILVLASGNHESNFLNSLNINWNIKNYNQFAITSNTTTQITNNNYAFEKFTGNGVITLLPIKKNKFSLIWCFPSKQKKQIKNWNDQEFLYNLQKNFGYKLGKFIDTSKRHIYPLILKTASNIIHNRIILTGNAAQTIHPIAGQGLNLGLRDAITLSKVLTQSYYLGMDPGSLYVLKKYQNLRQLDRNVTIYITDMIIKIFNNQNISIITGRNFGLNIMNSTSYIRKIFSKKMLGFF